MSDVEVVVDGESVTLRQSSLDRAGEMLAHARPASEPDARVPAPAYVDEGVITSAAAAAGGDDNDVFTVRSSDFGKEWMFEARAENGARRAAVATVHIDSDELWLYRAFAYTPYRHKGLCKALVALALRRRLAAASARPSVGYVELVTKFPRAAAACYVAAFKSAGYVYVDSFDASYPRYRTVAADDGARITSIDEYESAREHGLAVGDWIETMRFVEQRRGPSTARLATGGVVARRSRFRLDRPGEMTTVDILPKTVALALDALVVGVLPTLAEPNVLGMLSTEEWAAVSAAVRELAATNVAMHALDVAQPIFVERVLYYLVEPGVRLPYAEAAIARLLVDNAASFVQLGVAGRIDSRHGINEPSPYVRLGSRPLLESYVARHGGVVLTWHDIIDKSPPQALIRTLIERPDGVVEREPTGEYTDIELEAARELDIPAFVSLVGSPTTFNITESPRIALEALRRNIWSLAHVRAFFAGAQWSRDFGRSRDKEVALTLAYKLLPIVTSATATPPAFLWYILRVAARANDQELLRQLVARVLLQTIVGAIGAFSAASYQVNSEFRRGVSVKPIASVEIVDAFIRRTYPNVDDAYTLPPSRLQLGDFYGTVAKRILEGDDADAKRALLDHAIADNIVVELLDTFHTYMASAARFWTRTQWQAMGETVGRSTSQNNYTFYMYVMAANAPLAAVLFRSPPRREWRFDTVLWEARSIDAASFAAIDSVATAMAYIEWQITRGEYDRRDHLSSEGIDRVHAALSLPLFAAAADSANRPQLPSNVQTAIVTTSDYHPSPKFADLLLLAVRRTHFSVWTLANFIIPLAASDDVDVDLIAPFIPRSLDDALKMLFKIVVSARHTMYDARLVTKNVVNAMRQRLPDTDDDAMVTRLASMFTVNLLPYLDIIFNAAFSGFDAHVDAFLHGLVTNPDFPHTPEAEQLIGERFTSNTTQARVRAAFGSKRRRVSEAPLGTVPPQALTDLLTSMDAVAAVPREVFTNEDAARIFVANAPTSATPRAVRILERVAYFHPSLLAYVLPSLVAGYAHLVTPERAFANLDVSAALRVQPAAAGALVAATYGRLYARDFIGPLSPLAHTALVSAAPGAFVAYARHSPNAAREAARVFNNVALARTLRARIARELLGVVPLREQTSADFVRLYGQTAVTAAVYTADALARRTDIDAERWATYVRAVYVFARTGPKPFLHSTAARAALNAQFVADVNAHYTSVERDDLVHDAIASGVLDVDVALSFLDEPAARLALLAAYTEHARAALLRTDEPAAVAAALAAPTRVDVRLASDAPAVPPTAVAVGAARWAGVPLANADGGVVDIATFAAPRRDCSLCRRSLRSPSPFVDDVPLGKLRAAAVVARRPLRRDASTKRALAHTACLVASLVSRFAHGDTPLVALERLPSTMLLPLLARNHLGGMFLRRIRASEPFFALVKRARSNVDAVRVRLDAAHSGVRALDVTPTTATEARVLVTDAARFNRIEAAAALVDLAIAVNVARATDIVPAALPIVLRAVRLNESVYALLLTRYVALLPRTDVASLLPYGADARARVLDGVLRTRERPHWALLEALVAAAPSPPEAAARVVQRYAPDIRSDDVRAFLNMLERTSTRVLHIDTGDADDDDDLRLHLTDVLLHSEDKRANTALLTSLVTASSKDARAALLVAATSTADTGGVRRHRYWTRLPLQVAADPRIVDVALPDALVKTADAESLGLLVDAAHSPLLTLLTDSTQVEVLAHAPGARARVAGDAVPPSALRAHVLAAARRAALVI